MAKYGKFNRREFSRIDRARETAHGSVNEETFDADHDFHPRPDSSVDHLSDFSLAAAKNPKFLFPLSFSLSFPLSLISRETPRQDRVRRNYPPSPLRFATCNNFSFSFSSLLPRSIEVCQTGRVARVRTAILYSSIVDKEKRLMKYYATRKYMAAHAALSPFDQDPRKSPVPVPRGKMDRELGAMQRYIVSISSLFPLGPSSSRPISLHVISIPYLVLLPRRVSVIPYVWRAA